MRNQVIVHRVVKNVKRSGQYIEPHSHVFFHYIYSLGGHTQVTLEEKRCETEQGSLVLIPPGTVHGITSLDTSCCLDLKFSCSEALAARITGLPRYLKAVDDHANSLIRNIFEEAVGQEPDYDEIINIRLYELLILLLRQQSGGETGQAAVCYSLSAPDHENIRRALQIVEEELETPLRVADLAERCGYSENYFRQVFRQSVGMAPNAYINQRKIAKAKELMLYSEQNVTQIAEQLGYQSIHYFSRLFKKVSGITPTDYINRVKDNRPINVIHNANTPRGEFEIPVRDMAPEEPGTKG